MLWDLILRILPYVFILNTALIPSQFKPLTLDRVFSNDHFPSESKSEDLVTLVVTGDILPGRSVHLKYTQNKDPNYAFSQVAKVLKGSDITWVNLEGPLVSGCPVFLTGVIFCGAPELAEGLVNSGVDVANIANNHILNFGAGGRDETIQVLSAESIAISGEEQVAYKKVKGITFAFLGFDAVGKILNRPYIKSQINKAKNKSDVVLVQFHWGQEYTYLPKPAGENPVLMGRFAIDSGADLVIGNHPHWLQGMEFYKDKPIVYSHGNFVFDQTWSRETTEGMVGKYIFYKGRLVDIEFLPVVIDAPFIPRFATGSEKQRLLKVVRDASELLQD